MNTNRSRAPLTQKPAVHEMAGESRVAMIGLLVVQAVIGYEWLVSGITKLFSEFVATFG